MDAAASSPANPSGLASLFEQHRAELRRFLEAHCQNAGEADDLMQELWVKVAIVQVGPVGNGRAYLFRMANNLAIDHFRSRQQTMARQSSWLESLGRGDGAPEDQADPSPNAEAVIEERQEAEALAQAIVNLPPGARKALTLYRLEGLGHAEIARIMGISRSGVEKHLVVAMRHLRKFFCDRD
ncbi:RNA polymerase sigma-70 factor (ECF subfamily) [Novosphingobium sp. SG751A]|uniref:RNA polymerase sigma factor n=1 Tax=Novosphingobium sp. SG751A TaxID=2587000 RepID=UPI0020A6C597|nr:RNA polymerase sigma factor [Novosphingobium sp. SG751A]NOW46699.1 RNA polymerase sigma-70 factor (ECF subfamily) [Novosphingobium sp. SG751A]